MPYVITTKRPDHELVPVDPAGAAAMRIESRRAVATLEEARMAAFNTVAAHMPPVARMGRMAMDPREPTFAVPAATLPESGGTVGPLPDGTVIEVEGVPWWVLVRDSLTPLPIPFTSDDVLDAFNARQS